MEAPRRDFTGLEIRRRLAETVIRSPYAATPEISSDAGRHHEVQRVVWRRENEGHSASPKVAPAWPRPGVPGPIVGATRVNLANAHDQMLGPLRRLAECRETVPD